jgi:hypothetical protein
MGWVDTGLQAGSLCFFRGLLGSFVGVGVPLPSLIVVVVEKNRVWWRGGGGAAQPHPESVRQQGPADGARLEI